MAEERRNATLEDHEVRIRNLEMHQVEMAGDIKYIKSKIDNGVSSTIEKIFSKLDEIVPLVRSNTYWMDKVKQGFWWCSVIGVGGGFIAVLFMVLRKAMG